MRSVILSILIGVQLFSAEGAINTDSNSILSRHMSISQVVVLNDLDSLMTFYTPNARIFPHEYPIIYGREKIKTYWDRDNGDSIIAHKTTSHEIKIVDSNAYDYGTYAGVSVTRGGKVRSWQGKYMIIWEKIDSLWFIKLEIWNSSPGKEYLTINNNRVRYRYVNTFKNHLPTVVIESGFDEEIEDWDEVLHKVVSRGYSMLIYERPGYGESDYTEVERSAENINLELKILLDSLRIDQPVILVGHREGGVLAQNFVKNYPGRVGVLVLVDVDHGIWLEEFENCHTPEQWLTYEIFLEQRIKSLSGPLKAESKKLNSWYRGINELSDLSIAVRVIYSKNKEWNDALDNDCVQKAQLRAQSEFKSLSKGTNIIPSLLSTGNIIKSDPRIIAEEIGYFQIVQKGAKDKSKKKKRKKRRRRKD